MTVDDPVGPAPVIKKIQATIEGRIEKSVPKTPKKKRPGPSPAKFTPLHGWCPKCEFGHRVLGRFNPEGGGMYAGRKRYACSNAGDDGCNYYELFSEDAPSTHVATPVKDGACPQCRKGRLVEMIPNPFNFKERYLECNRKAAPERPCNYRFDISKSKQVSDTPRPPVPLFETPRKQPVIAGGQPDASQLEQGTPLGQAATGQGVANTPQQAVGNHRPQAETPQRGTQIPTYRHGYQPAVRSNRPLRGLSGPAAGDSTPGARQAHPLTPNHQFTGATMPTQTAGTPRSTNPTATDLGLNNIPYAMRTRATQNQATNPGPAAVFQAPRTITSSEDQMAPPSTMPRLVGPSPSNRRPSVHPPPPPQPSFSAPKAATRAVIDLTDDGPTTPTRPAASGTAFGANGAQSRRSPSVTPTRPPRTAPGQFQNRTLPARRVREPSVDYDNGLDDNDWEELAAEADRLQQTQQLQRQHSHLPRPQRQYQSRDEYGFSPADDEDLIQLADRVAFGTPRTAPAAYSSRYVQPRTPKSASSPRAVETPTRFSSGHPLVRAQAAEPLTPTRTPASFMPRQSQQGPPAFGPRRRVGY